MQKLIHRLNAKDLEVLRAIVEATREGQLAQADFQSARKWHDLRDKLDNALSTIHQDGSPIPSLS